MLQAFPHMWDIPFPEHGPAQAWLSHVGIHVRGVFEELHPQACKGVMACKPQNTDFQVQSQDPAMMHSPDATGKDISVLDRDALFQLNAMRFRTCMP